jgi:hypothetical protein
MTMPVFMMTMTSRHMATFFSIMDAAEWILLWVGNVFGDFEKCLPSYGDILFPLDLIGVIRFYSNVCKVIIFFSISGKMTTTISVGFLKSEKKNHETSTEMSKRNQRAAKRDVLHTMLDLKHSAETTKKQIEDIQHDLESTKYQLAERTKVAKTCFKVISSQGYKSDFIEKKLLEVQDEINIASVTLQGMPEEGSLKRYTEGILASVSRKLGEGYRDIKKEK